MSTAAFLLIDSGAPSEVPVIPDSFIFSFMPILGNFTAAEINLANLHGVETCRRYVVTLSTSFHELGDYLRDWHRPPDIVEYDEKSSSLVRALDKIDADYFIIQDSAAVVSYDFGKLIEAVESVSAGRINRFSVDGKHVDLFCCGKNFLTDFLRSEIDVSGRMTFEQFFFALRSAAEKKILSLEGKVFFNRNVYDFFSFHRKFISLSRGLPPAISELYERKPKDSIIGKNGTVNTSLLAPGVRIDGYVENSFIFSGVQVREGAEIINSVILPGHSIGKNSRISNTLIMPFFAEAVPGNTIGDRCVIGGDSQAVNKKFGDQIHDGLTVIGFDVEIPGGTEIEPAVCVADSVSKSELKRLKTIKRGSSVIAKE